MEARKARGLWTTIPTTSMANSELLRTSARLRARTILRARPSNANSKLSKAVASNRGKT